MIIPNQINPALPTRIPNAGNTLIGSSTSALITLAPMYNIPKTKNKAESGPPSSSDPTANNQSNPQITPRTPIMIGNGAR